MESLKVLWKERSYLAKLSWNFFKDKYRGSVLGISWAFITPVILALVISFVFTRVARITLPYYTLFVLSGLLPWMCFSSSLQESCFVLLESSSLLKQFPFPPILLPLAKSGANFLNFLLGWIILLPLFIYFKPNIILFLPLFLAFLIPFYFFTSGVGLILSWLHVFFRDTGHLLSLTLLFWFWLTPVFYPLTLVPSPYQKWMIINPLTSFMVVFHSLLYKGTLPPSREVLVLIVYTLLFYSLGSYSFSLKIKEALKWI